jgi:hypothetical protein
MAKHRIFAMKLRSLSSMSVSMPVAQVLSYKGSNAVREVAVIDLFGCMI